MAKARIPGTNNVTTRGTGNSDEPAGLAVQPDGKIVLGAHISVVPYQWSGKFGAIRLLGDTAPDTTAPQISYTLTGTQGDNGWYVSDVSVEWTVTDPESAVTTEGCAATTLTTDTAGTELTCRATSDGGTSSSSVTVKRDTVPPAFRDQWIVGEPVYWLNGGGTFSVLFTDSLSGPIEGTATTSIDTSSVGWTDVRIPVTDNAGNGWTYETSVQVAYVVRTDPPLTGEQGFYNQVKAGKLVPWRFTVTDARGVPVNDLTSVSLVADTGSCDGVPNEVSQYAKGKAGLVFLGSGAYEYRYKFPRGTTGSCLRATLQLGSASGWDTYERWTYFQVSR